MELIGPYARMLGVAVRQDAEGPLLVLPYADALIGRPGFLHGGVIAGLLEAAARAALRHALGDDPARAKTVTLTVDFLRGGVAIETRARGEVVRLGRRVANVVATAWQDDPARPIGAARMNLVLARD